jgi:FkbM family methyltransferase
MTSFSQLGQDLIVVNSYGRMRDGFFVEIGASDGIEFSDTYLLETKYNWTGICVEPIPKRYEELSKNRPNSSCCNDAIYSESTKVKFDIANRYDLLSGISKHIDTHKRDVDSDKTEIEVNTITLNTLLEQYNAPSFIHYMSLDTEGSELEILKSFDFKRYTFGLIDVEHNFVEPRRSEIRKLLLANGYEYIEENKWDDCYKHKTVDIDITRK